MFRFNAHRPRMDTLLILNISIIHRTGQALERCTLVHTERRIPEPRLRNLGEGRVKTCKSVVIARPIVSTVTIRYVYCDVGETQKWRST